jgi:hypothetical protein
VKQRSSGAGRSEPHPLFTVSEATVRWISKRNSNERTFAWCARTRSRKGVWYCFLERGCPANSSFGFCGLTEERSRSHRYSPPFHATRITPSPGACGHSTWGSHQIASLFPSEILMVWESAGGNIELGIPINISQRGNGLVTWLPSFLASPQGHGLCLSHQGGVTSCIRGMIFLMLPCTVTISTLASILLIQTYYSTVALYPSFPEKRDRTCATSQ